MAERWDSYNLPLPQRNGYGFEGDPGLVRTSMASGRPRQRRKYCHLPRMINVNIDCTPSVLQTLYAFMNEYGYSWFVMPLITDLNGRPEPIDHTVRCISKLKTSDVLWNRRTVSFALEVEFDPYGVAAENCS